MFDLWVQENGKPGEKYVQISRIDHVRGRVFSRIEKQVDWYLVDTQVYEAAESRVRWVEEANSYKQRPVGVHNQRGKANQVRYTLYYIPITYSIVRYTRY